MKKKPPPRHLGPPEPVRVVSGSLIRIVLLACIALAGAVFALVLHYRVHRPAPSPHDARPTRASSLPRSSSPSRAPRRAPERPRGEGRHTRRPRDLREHPGRIDVRRAAVHVRADHRLQPPLLVVRHGARLLRRHAHAPRRRARARARARHAARRAHRRRAAARSPARSPLLRELCDAGKTVLVETSGEADVLARRSARAQDHGPEGARLRRDRTATAGRTSRTSRARDEIKFVLADRADYEWMRDVIREPRAHGAHPDAPRERRLRGASPRRTSWPGCSRTSCPCACSSSCTSTSGRPETVGV